MTLSTCSADTSVIRDLPDEPTLTAAELKEAFDAPADNIKTWLNNTHISELESALSDKQNKITSVSDTKIGYLANVTSDIQAQLTALSTDKQKAITSGTEAPSGGSDGDIYLQYSAGE